MVVGSDFGEAYPSGGSGSTPPNRWAACEFGTRGIMPVIGTGREGG
ncbi:hypothetical protein RA11412_0159 [Rothia aeria]|uniref:Uncharacterized protein n=1 Tax=Rothia aeria TaxID=172042 RepID=A0A2Z5QVN7_9MICC|nr:hypothetical protein RA11412_0159 [Rothia aeria]